MAGKSKNPAPNFRIISNPAKGGTKIRMEMLLPDLNSVTYETYLRLCGGSEAVPKPDSQVRDVPGPADILI